MYSSLKATTSFNDDQQIKDGGKKEKIYGEKNNCCT